ncbi:MAG: hypothetical protein KDA85_03505 [Planctomycetaceae bacterium]|nr:hypothetical protein [Planctomycetaceae bacterium]
MRMGQDSGSDIRQRITDMWQRNPYQPPRSAPVRVPAPVHSRWFYIGLYTIGFATVYSAVVGLVAGTAVVERFISLRSFQRFEYGLQLIDGAGMAILLTSLVWWLSHRRRNTAGQILLGSVTAAAVYLCPFMWLFPTAFTWAVHGIPLGGARPFLPITGAMLTCSCAACCAALPIVLVRGDRSGTGGSAESTPVQSLPLRSADVHPAFHRADPLTDNAEGHDAVSLDV